MIYILRFIVPEDKLQTYKRFLCRYASDFHLFSVRVLPRLSAHLPIYNLAIFISSGVLLRAFSESFNNN